MQNLTYSLRVIWACAKKDIRSTLTERTLIILGSVVPLNFLILMSLLVISGGYAPTAVVMQDSGPYAQQLYDAMSNAHSFLLRKASETEAAQLIQTGRIVAIVTIPPDFDTRIQQNQPVQVEVEINNLNTDFTNDIRRAVPLSITSFYAKAFPKVATIVPREQDSYPQDTDYIPYLAVSVLVIGLLLGGTMQAGIGVAREWEKETMKELLLSPASRWPIVVGKMLGAFVVAVLSVLIVLLALIFVIGVRPIHWYEMIGASLLGLGTFIALGTLLGTVLRSRQSVIALAFGISIPLFFLSGAFGPIAFDTSAIQVIAQILPVYYAIVIQHYAFHHFVLNTYGPLANVLIVGAYALGLTLLAVIAFRRSAVAH